MIHFKKLWATNFLTFKDLSYDFVSHPILIQGENLTEDSQESNGSGKSVLLSAIEYALDKSTSRKVRDIDLIHFGEEEATVGLELYCDMREETLTILRKIKEKGSSELELSFSKSPQLKSATVNDGNKMIIDWIGISREDLMNYYLISKERYCSFFSSSNREKMDIIGRFSNSSFLNGIDKDVQKRVDEIADNKSKLIINWNQLYGKVGLLISQIRDEKNRDLQEEDNIKIKDIYDKISALRNSSNLIHDETIPNNRLHITEYKKSIDEKNKQLDEHNLRIKELNISIDKFNKDISVILSQMSDIDSNSINYQKSLDQKNDEINEINELLSEIERNLKGTAVCPKCHHEFVIADPDIDVQEERKAKEDSESLLEKVKLIKSDIVKSINKLNIDRLDKSSKKQSINIEIKRLNEKINEIDGFAKDLKSGISSIESAINQLNRKIESYENEIIGNNEKIRNFENQIHDIKTSPRSHNEDLITGNWSSIKALRKEMFDIKSKIYECSKEWSETNQWIVNFKKFNMFLANRSLKSIQGHCNKFLKDMGSDIQIRWEGYKVLSNGIIKEEISSYVIRDNNIRNFWSFSGGERARMDYSMIFTMQHMINSTNKYGGCDILITDEVAEGLDAKGLSDLMNSLRDMNKTVLITTHVVNRNISDDVLIVRKVKGVSMLLN